jgi:CRP-like cAMP-binding protein
VLGDLSQLAGASHARLEELAAATSTEHWQAGDAVIREGDDADAVFVVLAGQATVTARGEPVGALHPGDAFGEIAVLHGTPRTATVTATEPLTTCRIPGAEYLATVTMHPTPVAEA